MSRNEEIRVESITGGLFRGRVIEETRCGVVPAVITQVTGSAHITGLHQFVVDASDRLREGLLIG